ncbi:threonine ammonia-lyase [Haladaptatus caseinilyticus]|uniref:threonine ammonia-lyase n=1 Tax=Haladaptatus caseinilyticus TaxID=2993314 RepID=UPI00224B238A|nr:threonine ammonia-lyase [Haladaptatus caseinilyticus]
MSDRKALDIVTADAVAAAHDRIEAIVHRTPVDSSTTFADMSGASSVGLKLENMQRTGSFKIRGAYNTMAQLSEQTKDRGVIASSAGNHAQGVALAGDILGIDTTIVVPEVTPAAKIEATRGYGAEVIVEGKIYEHSYEYALELAEEMELEFIHPFNDEGVIAGQGTVGKELIEQYPTLDTVVVSIGGGGLISGIATVLKQHDPSIRVIGVQPAGAYHAKPSLKRDEIRELSEIDTVAEGIADTRLLEKTFTVIREYVDDVVSVSDLEMSVALTLLAERAKTVVETAGAAPVAALLSDAVDVRGEHVAAVVSGGNVNLTEHGELTRTGLMHLGRYAEVEIAVDNWPTGVSAVTTTTESQGAELDVLERTRRTAQDDPNRTPIRVGIEGSGTEHLQSVIDALDSLDELSVTSHTLA